MFLLNCSFFAAIFDFFPIRMIAVDHNGVIVEINESKKINDRRPNIGDRMYIDYAGKHKIDMRAELMQCMESGEEKEFPELLYDSNLLRIKIIPSPYGAVIISEDITSKKQVEELLGKRAHMFSAFAETAPWLACTIDIGNGKLIYTSPALRALLEYFQEEIEQLSCFDLVHDNSKGKIKESLQYIINGGAPKEKEYQFVTKTGRILWLSVTAIVAENVEGKPKILVGGFDITQMKKREEMHREIADRMAWHAHHDALTGLANRILWKDRLDVAIKQARRNGDKLIIAMLDLDKFKDVDDNYGHDTGDKLLQSVAKRLPELVRDEDTVARYGGDEFALLCPNRSTSKRKW